MSAFNYGGEERNAEHKTPLLVMPPPRQKPTRWQLWRARLFLIEFIFVCIVVGIILVAAPWLPIWSENSLLNGFPQLREALTNYFVRGLISGLGLVDIWLAISEAVRYRESGLSD
jgi:hypothetical protein